MKVGTDGVLLGAWVRVSSSVCRILDIGTGTGVIALMLAQRTQERSGVRITALDIGEVAEARANADASPWGARVETVQCPVQRFEPAERYDLIVSNPPFFVDSLASPDAGRSRARHASELPFDELHDAVVRLLAPGGRFALVLPPPEAGLFLAECRSLRMVRCTEVRSTPRRGVRRVLMEFAHGWGGGTIDEREGPERTSGEASERSVQHRTAHGFGFGYAAVCGRDGAVRGTGGGAACCGEKGSAFGAGGSAADCERDELTIGTGAHEEYTEEYRALTRDFYLKF